MPLDVKPKTPRTVNANSTCVRCGASYQKKTGFYTSYAAMYKGSGHLPICKQCTDDLYEAYLSETSNPKAAARQLCRKLDLVWRDDFFDSALAKSGDHNAFQTYLQKINAVSQVSKCYDDTLRSEGTMWKFSKLAPSLTEKYEDTGESVSDGSFQVTPEIVAFWGSGIRHDMYQELEDRKRYWIEECEKEGVEISVGLLATLRQICNLELDINKNLSAGKPIDKNVNALNTLIGSCNLKPVQKKAEDADASLEQPLGVWLNRYENFRPLPEVDEDCKDVNGLMRYITVWVFGHLCKMLGIRNSYCQMYEDEMARLRVEKPEYADEDDDAFLTDYLNEADSDDEV